MENLQYKKFSEIDLNNEFFDSLKSDYSTFENWFNRKREENESAYIQINKNNIDGFLYLKIEPGPTNDIIPPITDLKILKIGTMKITPHGTRLGERFVKKSLDFAIKNDIKVIYVTIFDKHEALINIYKKYGFEEYGIKSSTDGKEKVFIKRLDIFKDDFQKNYPLINKSSNSYLLAIKPEFHTKLFPDSKLNTEDFDIVCDVSHTNSIEKIYICQMAGVKLFKPGDLVVMYRTTDIPGKAWFRAVASSICTIESVRSTRHFKSFGEFKSHCKNYSVFTDDELQRFYFSRSEFYIIKMSYNIAFSKRLTRGHLISKIGLDGNIRWNTFPLTNSQLNQILLDAKINPNYIF